MTRQPAIYAIHGENDLDYPGWEIRTEELGHDPTHAGGTDYRHARHTVIARLNHGYEPNGTIPRPEHYQAFAARVARFVAASEGCTRWIIGNEPNCAWERPGGMPITPDLYARCYDLCYQAIHSLPGHQNDEVLIAAVGPWNPQTTYPGNDRGDWLTYFRHIQEHARTLDGFAIHAYAREQNPDAVNRRNPMVPPDWSGHDWGFRVFEDWMNMIRAEYRGLPVYCTEFNANAPWQNINNGFVQAAYQAIHSWNWAHRRRPISCLALYRWQTDKWVIRDKPEVLRDSQQAVNLGYVVPDPCPPVDDPPQPEPEPPQPEPPPAQPAPDYAEALTRIEAMLIEQGAQLDELMERFRVAGFALAGEQ